MKSQNVFLLLCTYLLLTFSTKAQDIAPFQANDVAAIKLTPAILQQLTDKDWYLHNRSYVEKGVTDDYRHYNYSAYQFQPGGICQQPELRSTWTTNRQENLLIVTSDYPEKAKKLQHLLSGGYAVYRITEEELILGKVLTSTFDTKILYCFENEERHEQRKLAKMAERYRNYDKREQEEITIKALEKKYEGQEGETTITTLEEENGKLMEKLYNKLLDATDETNLKLMTKEDLFMRNIEPEPGYVYYFVGENKVVKIKKTDD